jgi:hypothetical protein
MTTNRQRAIEICGAVSAAAGFFFMRSMLSKLPVRTFNPLI